MQAFIPSRLRAPRWPNPELSTGELYREVGRLSCWEAKGEVRQRFIEAYEDIKIYLERYGAPVNHRVNWSVYMIGRTPKTSEPTILFSCEAPKCKFGCRKKAKKTVEEGQVMQKDKYLGFRLDDCSQPPDFGRRLVQLAQPQMSPNLQSSRFSPVDSLDESDQFFGLEGYRHLNLASLKDGDKIETEIRLLIIEPAQPADSVVLRVVHTLNVEDLNYRAFSFSGSNTSEKQPITVDGMQYDIPSILANFLKGLRLETEETTIWLDVFCMKPENEDEFKLPYVSIPYELDDATSNDELSAQGWTTLRNLVRATVADVMKVDPSELSRDGNILSLGMDSLKATITSRIREEFGVEISSDLLMQDGSIDSIMALINLGRQNENARNQSDSGNRILEPSLQIDTNQMSKVPTPVVGFQVVIHRMDKKHLPNHCATRQAGRVTLGGIVESGDNYFCLTAAHPFLEPAKFEDDYVSDEEDDFEWSIGEEDFLDGSGLDTVETTSRGSVSPEVSPEVRDYNCSEDTLDSLEASALTPTPTPHDTEAADSTLLIPGDLGDLDDDLPSQIISQPKRPKGEIREVVGFLAMTSLDHPSSALDYALIKLRSSQIPRLRSIIKSRSSSTQVISQDIESYVHVRYNINREVIAFVGSAGILRGTLSGTPTFTQVALLSPPTFRELWTIRFQGQLAVGDSGSWVVDINSQQLLGHIVSGSPETGVAYIVPAYAIFNEISERIDSSLRLKLRLPSQNDFLRMEDSEVAASHPLEISRNIPEVGHMAPIKLTVDESLERGASIEKEKLTGPRISRPRNPQLPISPIRDYRPSVAVEASIGPSLSTRKKRLTSRSRTDQYRTSRKIAMLTTSEDEENDYGDEQDSDIIDPIPFETALDKPAISVRRPLRLSARDPYIEQPHPGKTGSTQRSRQIPKIAVAPRNTYKYAPLKKGEQIRVFHLFKGRQQDPIQGTITHSTMRTDYEALTYEWGPGEAVHEVQIQGQPLHQLQRKINGSLFIRPNLFHALQGIRDPDRDIALWVDAISMDRSNEKELSQQVTQIAEVYRNANTVLAWLGIPSIDEARYARSGQLPTFLFISHVVDMFDLDYRLTDDYVAGWWRLSLMMKNGLFSRRWIIPEFALAREVILFCGNYSIHWSDFAEAVALFAEKFEQIKILPEWRLLMQRSLDPFSDISKLPVSILVSVLSRFARKNGRGEIIEYNMSLEELVMSLTQFETSDPRDNIYALLSLARDTDRSPIKTSRISIKGVSDVNVSHAKKVMVDPDKIGSKALDIITTELASKRLELKVDLDMADTRLFTQANPVILDRLRKELNLDIPFSESKKLETLDDLKRYIRRLYPSDNLPKHVTLGPLVRKKTQHTLHSVVPDYNKELIEVCQQFVESSIRTSKSLDIICRHWAPNPKQITNSYIRSRIKNFDLPSWMPLVSEGAFSRPWNLGTTRTFGDSFVGLPGKPIYNASSRLQFDYKSIDFERADSQWRRSRKLESESEPYFTELASPFFKLSRSVGSSTAALSSTRFTVPSKSIWPRTLNKVVQRLRIQGIVNMLSPSRSQSHRLRVRGIAIDFVRSVGPRCVSGTITEETLRLGGWIPVRKLRQVDEKGDIFPDALWQTLVAGRGHNGEQPPAWYRRAFEHVLKLANTGSRIDIETNILMGTCGSSVLRKFLERLRDVVWNRVLFTGSTELLEGRLGLGPPEMRGGDQICVLRGCSVPVVLRKLETEDGSAEEKYELIGECFMNGVMQGQAVEELGEDVAFLERSFMLV